MLKAMRILAYGCLGALATLAFASCGDGNQALPPEGRSAMDVALRASRAEGVLSGDAKETGASRMTLREAQEVLTGWGAVFAEYADYPSLESTVWVVSILGEGVPPAPPRGQAGEECLDVRVIVLEGQQEELHIFGKPGSGC